MCVATLAFFARLGVPASGLCLVEDGAPRAVIVLPAAPSAGAKRASTILQSHLEQISGAKVPVLPEGKVEGPPSKQRCLILVGEGSLAKQLGFSTAGLGAGGMHVEAKGDVLAILGTDSQTPSDANGTLYATAAFLEKLGVRYLWPGETGKVIPRKPTIEIEDFQIRSAPALAQRQIRSLGYNDRLQSGITRLKFTKEDFAKFRADAQQARDPLDRLTTTKEDQEKFGARAELVVTDHDWFWWQGLGGTMNIAGGHAFGQLWARYGKEHPDWFALQPNGSRDQSSGGDRARLCKSNPELIAAIANEKIEEFRKNPALRSVSLGPNDGGRTSFCTCPKCEALDAPGGRIIKLWDFTGKESRFFDHVSLTDRMVYFWNVIAEQVTKVCPDKLFVVDAYSAYSAPPVQRTLHPNLVVRFAALSYSDEANRQESLRDWDAWAKAAKLIYFRSNLMLAARRTGMPLLYMHRFAEDFRHLATTGMMGTDLDSCCHHWATEGLNYYVVARLHWDPSQNVDAIIDDYCASGFGPAAKTMRRYFDTLEALFTESSKKDREKRGGSFTDAVLADLRSLLEQAKSEAASDAGSLSRIEFIGQGLRWADVEERAHRLLVDPEKNDKAEVKRVLDERYELMRELFRNHPFAVNVALVSWGEDGVWSRVGYKFPK